MIDTVQTRFRGGYTRRFEIALAIALTLHVLAMMLVPPSRGPAAPEFVNSAMRLINLDYPPNIEVIDPEDVPRPRLGETMVRVADLPDPIAPPVPSLPVPAPPSTGTPRSKEPPFSALETPPRVIKTVEPVYPALAREAGAEGTVVLDLRITDTGRVSETKVVRSDTIESLEKAAQAAALQWLFTPGRQRDRVVPCTLRVSMRFRIS
jgi:protein TonB